MYCVGTYIQTDIDMANLIKVSYHGGNTAIEDNPIYIEEDTDLLHWYPMTWALTLIFFQFVLKSFVNNHKDVAELDEGAVRGLVS